MKYTKNSEFDLLKVNIDFFLNNQKINGRKGLNKEKIVYFSQLSLLEKKIMNKKNYDSELNKTVHFLSVITDSILKLSIDPIPNYDIYVELIVFDWYLENTKNTDHYSKEKILRGIYYLAEDLLKFEQGTLDKNEIYYQKEIDNIDLPKRVFLLESLLEIVNKASFELLNFEFSRNPEWDNFNDITDFAKQENKIAGFIKFSCFPITEYHDEYTFIRTIQISELCFLSLKHLVNNIINNIKVNKVAAAEKLVEEASMYIDILYNIFKVLKTMPIKPVNNFMHFRDYTGNASAIQSKNYQEFEILLYGIKSAKREIYDRIPNLNYLKIYEDIKFGHNLLTVIQEYKIEEYPSLNESLLKFDKKILKWKALHLGFALSYLPPSIIGTGSTEGASYLKKIFKYSIFKKEQIDTSLELVQDIKRCPFSS